MEAVFPISANRCIGSNCFIETEPYMGSLSESDILFISSTTCHIEYCLPFAILYIHQKSPFILSTLR
ncbi:MAG: hypothetical protein BWY04_00524 [candidate division CPR1 bacterium ADurb.Bin160]|uniref:Uncharacterized protein n=1 Tax=candidate division CPR1 bacterium ADurb.Bin160 TaxID=1852826 RepID=A0A1V5ZP93_9BACT|nr:MAG: hypothetical protein BWY04_00524 [candidate division CPR1 bacterium ADurb.Bin160]